MLILTLHLMHFSVPALEIVEKPKKHSTPQHGTVVENRRVSSLISDDEPLYDSVASDEDSLLELQMQQLERRSNPSVPEVVKIVMPMMLMSTAVILIIIVVTLMILMIMAVMLMITAVMLIITVATLMTFMSSI